MRRDIPTDFLFVNLKGRDNMEEAGVEGRIINLKEMKGEGVEWVRLAQDRKKWCVLGLSASIKRGEYLD